MYIILFPFLSHNFPKVEEEKPANWLKKSLSNWVPASTTSSSSPSSSSSSNSEEKRLKIVDHSDKPMGDSSLAVCFYPKINIYSKIYKDISISLYLLYFYLVFIIS